MLWEDEVQKNSRAKLPPSRRWAGPSYVDERDVRRDGKNRISVYRL